MINWDAITAISSMTMVVAVIVIAWCTIYFTNESAKAATKAANDQVRAWIASSLPEFVWVETTDHPTDPTTTIKITCSWTNAGKTPANDCVVYIHWVYSEGLSSTSEELPSPRSFKDFGDIPPDVTRTHSTDMEFDEWQTRALREIRGRVFISILMKFTDIYGDKQTHSKTGFVILADITPGDTEPRAIPITFGNIK